MIAETLAVGSNFAQIGSFLCDTGGVNQINAQKHQSILDATCANIDQIVTLLEHMENFVVLYAEHKDKKIYKELIQRSKMHNTMYLELSAAETTLFSYISHQCAVRKLRSQVREDWILLQKTSRKLRITHLETVKDGVQCTVSQLSNTTMVNEVSGVSPISPSDSLDTSKINSDLTPTKSTRGGLKKVVKFLVPFSSINSRGKQKETRRLEPNLDSYNVEFEELGHEHRSDNDDSDSPPSAGPSKSK